MAQRVSAAEMARNQRPSVLATDAVRDGDGNAFVAELDLTTFRITLLRNGQELTRECAWSVAGHNIRFPKDLDPLTGASPLPTHVAIRLRDFLKRRIPFGYAPPQYAGD